MSEKLSLFGAIVAAVAALVWLALRSGPEPVDRDDQWGTDTEGTRRHHPGDGHDHGGGGGGGGDD